MANPPQPTPSTTRSNANHAATNGGKNIVAVQPPPANNPAPASTDDTELLALLANPATHERGFRMMMHLYQERLYWHIRRMTSDHDDTNDIVQTTFIRAFRGLHTFKGEARLYTWLYRIATNEAITFINRTKKRAILSFDNDSDEGNSWDDLLPAETPLENPDDLLLRLERAIAALPPKQRIVFNMRYYDELSYRDISEILGTSEGALKASFHHAAKKVEEYLLR